MIDVLGVMREEYWGARKPRYLLEIKKKPKSPPRKPLKVAKEPSALSKLRISKDQSSVDKDSLNTPALISPTSLPRVDSSELTQQASNSVTLQVTLNATPGLRSLCKSTLSPQTNLQHQSDEEKTELMRAKFK